MDRQQPQTRTKFDGLVQDCSNSIALLQSCTKPSDGDPVQQHTHE